MATIAELAVNIKTKNAKLNTGLKKAEDSVKRFASKAIAVMKKVAVAITVAVTAAAAAIGAVLSSTADQFRELQNIAAKSGLGFREFQRLSFIARQAGLDTEQVVDAVAELTKKIAEADLLKSGSAVDALRILGLNAARLKQLAPEKQFEKIVESLRSVKNVSERAFLADELFSGEGVMIAERLLNTYQDGLSGVSKEFDKLGIAITDQQAKAIEAFNSARSRLGSLADSFRTKVTAALAPFFIEMIEGVEAWIEKNGGLEKSALSVASVLEGAFSTMASFLKGAITLVEKLVAVYDKLAAAINKVKESAVGQAIGSAVSNIRDRLAPQEQQFTPEQQRVREQIFGQSVAPQRIIVKFEADKDKLVNAVVSSDSFNTRVSATATTTTRDAARATRR